MLANHRTEKKLYVPVVELVHVVDGTFIVVASASYRGRRQKAGLNMGELEGAIRHMRPPTTKRGHGALVLTVLARELKADVAKRVDGLGRGRLIDDLFVARLQGFILRKDGAQEEDGNDKAIKLHHLVVQHKTKRVYMLKSGPLANDANVLK